MLRRIALLLAITTLLLAGYEVLAQDSDLPTCTLSLSDVSSDVSTHLRLRKERIDDLYEIISPIKDEQVDDEMAQDLMYWVVMADSASFRSRGTEYPPCKEYQFLDETFDSILATTYAASVQSTMLLSDELTDFQKDNVTDLLKVSLTSMTYEVLVWKLFYDGLDH